MAEIKETLKKAAVYVDGLRWLDRTSLALVNRSRTRSSFQTREGRYTVLSGESPSLLRPYWRWWKYSCCEGRRIMNAFTEITLTSTPAREARHSICRYHASQCIQQRVNTVAYLRVYSTDAPAHPLNIVLPFSSSHTHPTTKSSKSILMKVIAT